MQKHERQIEDDVIIHNILKNGKYASISMCRNNEPYIITLSYGYDALKNSLYFHSAKEGLKYEFIKTNSLVCGTVIEDKGYKTNQCSHAYRSVVFWGEMNLIQDIMEKKHGFEIMIDQLEEDPIKVKKRFLENKNSYQDTSILRLDITYITGKTSE
jgi:nitroimidazol reductase NimA-like FMN-containing flavoprotein (pyridoxamine 5'-phosphate oxidase superfamily)